MSGRAWSFALLSWDFQTADLGTWRCRFPSSLLLINMLSLLAGRDQLIGVVHASAAAAGRLDLITTSLAGRDRWDSHLQNKLCI